MKIAQKRAIYYAYKKQEDLKTEKYLEFTRKKGFHVEKAPYNAVTQRKCLQLLCTLEEYKNKMFCDIEKDIFNN